MCDLQEFLFQQIRRTMPVRFHQGYQCQRSWCSSLPTSRNWLTFGKGGRSSYVASTWYYPWTVQYPISFPFKHRNNKEMRIPKSFHPIELAHHSRRSSPASFQSQRSSPWATPKFHLCSPVWYPLGNRRRRHQSRFWRLGCRSCDGGLSVGRGKGGVFWTHRTSWGDAKGSRGMDQGARFSQRWG